MCKKDKRKKCDKDFEFHFELNEEQLQGFQQKVMLYKCYCDCFIYNKF